MIVKWHAVAVVAAALLASACASALPPTVPKGFENEARYRKQRCDELGRELAPSRAGGVALGPFGVSFSNQNPGDARDQYLVALVDLLKACRQYAAFEIDRGQYADAESRMSRVYTQTLDAAEVEEAQRKLAEALVTAEQARKADAAETDRRLERLLNRAPEAPSDFGDILARIDQLDERMQREITALRASLPNEPPAAPHAGAPPITEWRVRFSSDDDPADPADLERQLLEIQQTLASYRSYEVEVRGYADATGSRATNYRTSKDRADYVYYRLIGLGAVPLYAFGMGPTNRFGTGRENRIVQIRLTRR